MLQRRTFGAAIALGFQIAAAAPAAASQQQVPPPTDRADTTPPEPALVRAVLTGTLDEVKKALAAGADVNQTAGSGVSPLAAAALQGRVDMMESLLAAGASVDAGDVTRTTPLMTAASQGHLSAVELLIKRGANPNVQDQSGMTALMAAASSGRDDMVRLLIDRGADVTARDKQGTTALMAAAFGGHAAAGRVLIGPTQARTQKMLPTENIQRQIAIFGVIAVEKSSLLMAVHGIVGGIHVEHHLLRRPALRLDENLPSAHRSFLPRPQSSCNGCSHWHPQGLTPAD